MQEVDLKTYDKDLSGLFEDYHWNFIPDAILEGTLGKVLVNDLENPQVGILTIPEFKVSFLGGDASHPAVHSYLEDLPRFSMLMFASEGWPETLREIHPGNLVVLERYGFTTENLNIEHLQTLQAHLSDEYRIEKIDLLMARQIMEDKKDALTGEQLFGYASPEDYMARGVGYCAFQGDEMVSIAAAGLTCKKGIEIQINTRKKFEGQGLGTAVAAALIIDCLEQGIEPNWDAATEISAGLAKKLGYTPKGEYLMYGYLKSKFLVRLRTFLRKIRKKEIIQP